MRTIKITTTRTYTKTAVVEIPFPDDIHNLDEVSDFLYDNEDLYREEMDNKISVAEEDCDPQFDSTRYDVVETVVLSKKVWGGTL